MPSKTKPPIVEALELAAMSLREPEPDDMACMLDLLTAHVLAEKRELTRKGRRLERALKWLEELQSEDFKPDAK